MNFPWHEILTWARRRKVFSAGLVVATLAVGILIGTVISHNARAAREQGGVPGASPLAAPSPVQMSSTFGQIAKAVEPAVVNINTRSLPQRRPRRRPAPGQGGPFEDFFDRFFGPFDMEPRPERSLGSGVIVDKSGLIITNYHVITQGNNKAADTIQVRLYEESKLYDAKVIGFDAETDLAVIKIDAGKALPTARLGNSEGVNVGDWVLAFGSPFGLEATMTAGIISAKNRDNRVVAGGGQLQRFLQTDAAINPGNSGGPLVNLAGEVIGINTAIITQTRGFEGVGFALPSNIAISVYNQIIKYGRPVRGSIGISFRAADSENPALLRQLGVTYGVVISEVRPGSPAERAGLKVQDVVTGFNGQAVRTGDELVNKITATPIGETIRLRVVRQKKESEIGVAVEDRAKIFPEVAGVPGGALPEQGGEAAAFGLRLGEVTPEIASQLGMREPHGVAVVGVEPGSFADEIGLARGDIIVEFNQQPIDSQADFRRIQRSLRPGDDAMFRVERRGPEGRMTTLFLAGTLPAEGQ
ncbi:MAG TPA: trypsin-like peptidase domain-containing protein [Candidatus Acidoferrales bacterium]